MLLCVLVSSLKSQTVFEKNDYTTRISSITWIPDGNAILLGIVKHHKTNRQAPFFSKVILYDLQKRNFTHLFDDGSNLAVSPDGKTIAYLKRSEKNKTDIQFYHTSTGHNSVLKIDTLPKFALDWSADGKNLIYNTRKGNGPTAAVNIFVLNLATKQVKQISKSEHHKSYNPTAGPDGKSIAYYLEKGDGRDQIWLTDINGSFHKNLSNDTATHNYYPEWIDDKSIFYTQSPQTIMIVDKDGNNKRKIEGLETTSAKYNAKTLSFAYIKSDEENKLMLFDFNTGKTLEILDGTTLLGLF